MPTYYKGGAGEGYLHIKNVQNLEQLFHHLIMLDSTGFEPYRALAKQYLSGERTPTRQLKKTALNTIVQTTTPRHLIKHIIREAESHKDPGQVSQLGGGITEGIHTLTYEILHLVGVDAIAPSVFGIKDPYKVMPLDAQFAAWLTDLTYKNVPDRKRETLGRFTRLPEYDSRYCSVWQHKDTGELTLAIRGTKFSARDLGLDALVMFGKTNVKSQEVETVMNKLEQNFPSQRYNVAAHSLGCDFVFTELDHMDHWDQLYMFNPGSSPAQSSSKLEEYANIPNASYFFNTGDMIGDSIRQQADSVTLENNTYFGPYRWAPWSAHSMSQWVPREWGGIDTLPQSYEGLTDLNPDSRMDQDTPETQQAGLS